MCPLWFSQIAPAMVWSQSQNHRLKTKKRHMEAPTQFCWELWPPLQLDHMLLTPLDWNARTQIMSHQTHLVWDVNSVPWGQTFPSPAFIQWCRHCTKHVGMTTIKNEYVGDEGWCTVCYTGWPTGIGRFLNEQYSCVFLRNSYFITQNSIELHAIWNAY